MESKNDLSYIATNFPFLLFEFTSVTSTQDIAKQLAHKYMPTSNTPLVCVAQSQTKGRGRGKHSWCSVSEKNIYLSIVVPIPLPLHRHVNLLTALTSLSIYQLFNYWQIQGCRIKWPNDILIFDKKISGVLIEVVHISNVCKTSLSPYAIIGIGINVNMDSQEIACIPNKKATSILIETGHTWCLESIRNAIIQAILYELHQPVSHTSIIHRWTQACKWMIGTITTTHDIDGTSCQGVVAGFNQEGALLLKDTGTQSLSNRVVKI